MPLDIIDHAYAKLVARDLEACAALLADDVRMHLAGAPGVLTGVDVWRANTASLLDAFADLAITVDDTLVDGDRVVCLVTLTGRQVGEFLGRPPTGRTASWTSYEVYRVQDGVITEEWICSDLFSLTAQLDAA